MYMAVCYGFRQPGESPGLQLSDTPNIGMLNFNTLDMEVLIHSVFGILAQTLRENMPCIIILKLLSYLRMIYFSVVILSSHNLMRRLICYISVPLVYFFSLFFDNV